ncbi:MAG: PHP domain-containing protein [Proteobacteria bacterium]|nr:PHP domain-containing protein [Pseudomonadota bacterium]
MERIDLHAHTTASDGTLTPSELVDLARREGLKAVAVTDHDTLDGLSEALARAREIGLELVPGVEISAEFKPGTMHILGYYLEPDASELAARLAELQEARRTRNPKIISRLAELGIEISMAEVENLAGGGQVGRPHMAKALVGKGYVSSIDEAFNRYLAKGGPAYVEKFRLSPTQAVRMIREAGGTPVLAHPFTLRLDESGLKDTARQLEEAGLEGIEVYYPEHTPQMTRDYLALARAFNLIPTGGSDFHGENKAGVELGRGFGDLAVSYDLLADMKQRRKERT